MDPTPSKGDACWRALLKKYVEHVGQKEGADFIRVSQWDRETHEPIDWCAPDERVVMDQIQAELKAGAIAEWEARKA